MKIVILEEALQSGTGHWPIYIGDIAEEFRHEGDCVDVLAHLKADQGLLETLGATPWLSRNCWTDPACQGQIGGLRHALRYAREVSGWLQQAPQTDWVCSLTTRLQHLLAVTWLSRRPGYHGRHRYLLLFVQGFGVYQGPGMPVAFPATMSNRLARWCFHRLKRAVRTGVVVLAAETRAMQMELAAFSGLPVQLFPHPVGQAPERIKPHPPSNSAVTITCPGFARYEKGNDLLQDACKLLFTSKPDLNIQVISQWPEPFSLPDGTEVFPDPSLLKDRRYQLINKSLNRAGYAALLARSDLIVLPYRRSSYHNRVSRVAIEAALHGLPLVYMSNTWIEEIVELTGAGVGIAEESAASLSEALLTAINNLPQLTLRAQSQASAVRKHYSGERFRDQLLTL